jgi:peptidoglycan/LPS O-acetylase OafA/YrhL
MASSDYYPHIDGLRSLSVGVVVLYHAQLGFSGGYVGVDAFFVISGYLITGLIIRDLECGSFSFRNFFARRMRRILPAQWVVVSTVVIVSCLLIIQSDFVSVLKVAFANCCMLANVALWSMVGYFNHDASRSPLLHLWSLAIEEQFYLVFPFALVTLWKYGRLVVLSSIIVIMFASFAMSVYASHHHPSANFFLLPFRAWELMLGAVLALSGVALSASQAKRSWVCDVLAGAGLASLCSSAVLYTERTSFPGVAALLPCIGTALVIIGGSSASTWTHWLLSSRWFVGIGRISYSIYLWHWPLLVFMSYWFLEAVPWYVRVAGAVITIPVGYVSWRFVEQPYRAITFKDGRKSNSLFKLWLKTSVSVNGAIAAVVAVLLVSKYQPLMPPIAQQYASGVTDRAFLNTVTLADVKGGELPRMGAPSGHIDVLLWGDSHAMAAAPVIDELCKKYGLTGAMATYSSTPPLLGFVSHSDWGLNEENLEYSELVTQIVENQGIKLVVLVGIWEHYGNIPTRLNAATFDDALQKTVERLQTSGAQVALMLEVPKQSTGMVPHLLAREAFLGHDVALVGVDLQDHLNKYAGINQRILNACNENVFILDPTTLFLTDGGRLRAELNGYSLYADSHHLTVHGARLLVTVFEPVFKSLRVQADNTQRLGDTTLVPPI